MIYFFNDTATTEIYTLSLHDALPISGRVGEDEPAPRGLEVPVGDVDRDALLALGAQAVREQREVDRVEAAPGADVRDVRQLVGEDLLGVVEQPADQRRLAVVDGPAGDEADEPAGGLSR